MQTIINLKELIKNAEQIDGMTNFYDEEAVIYQNGNKFFFIIDNSKASKNFDSWEAATNCLYKHGFIW